MFIKCMVLAITEFLPPNTKSLLSSGHTLQPVLCSAIRDELPPTRPNQMSPFPGRNYKKKKVLSVPLFFHSILPPGTELLPFCTCCLLPIFLIFAVLVQIFSPATDFCPSLLQHWRITENSKIQGLHFWHC